MASIYRVEPSSTPDRLDLFLDDELVGSSRELQAVAGLVLWSINREVNRRVDDAVLVHAAAAATDGRAVILPGASGSGKSTLVTALVARGYGYLTDEAAAFSLPGGSIRAYHRPISLKPGSWPLFPEFEPVTPPAVPSFTTEQWHIDPRTLRGDALCASARPGLILLPRHDPTGPTRLDKVAPAEALLALVDNTLNLWRLGQAGLDTLAEATRTSACYRLVFHDLAEAMDAIDEAVAQRPS